MKLYVLMQWKGENEQPEFQGAFDSEEKMLKACANDNYFVWIATLNEELPEETSKDVNGYYPLREDKPPEL